MLCPPAEKWWQGILPLRTHTPLKEGRESLFRGENTRPKPGEDPNRKQTEQENKRTERPHVGSPRAKPNQETRKTGEPEFRVTAKGKDPETLLNLVEKEHREVEERHHEHAIPTRAKRNTRKYLEKREEKKKERKKERESEKEKKEEKGVRCVFGAPQPARGKEKGRKGKEKKKKERKEDKGAEMRI